MLPYNITDVCGVVVETAFADNDSNISSDSSDIKEDVVEQIRRLSCELLAGIREDFIAPAEQFVGKVRNENHQTSRTGRVVLYYG